MLKRSVTQTKQWTWASATNVQEDLLRDGIITHIDFVLEITPSATLAGANQPDGPFRLIDNFTIKGGSHTYFTLPAEQGGRVWHYVMRKLMKHMGHGTAGITAPNLLQEPIVFRFHPGSRPLLPDGSVNFFDLTALIPALEESSLVGTWLTTANNVMDDVVTLTSAVMKATIYMLQGDPDEILAEMIAQGVPLDPTTGKPALLIPASEAEVFPTTATKSDYTEERNLPTGGFLRGIGILAQDATATRPLRASDVLTGIAVKMPKLSTRLVEQDFESLWTDQPSGSYLEADDAAIDGGQHVPNGVAYLPLRDRGISAMGREYGINMEGAGTGDWKIGMTIGTYASGDDVLLWYDKLVRYTGHWLK